MVEAGARVEWDTSGEREAQLQSRFKDQMDRKIDRQIERQIDRKKYRNIDRKIDRKIYRKIDRNKDGQKNRQIKRNKDGQNNRQIKINKDGQKGRGNQRKENRNYIYIMITHCFWLDCKSFNQPACRNFNYLNTMYSRRGQY